MLIKNFSSILFKLITSMGPKKKGGRREIEINDIE